MPLIKRALMKLLKVPIREKQKIINRHITERIIVQYQIIFSQFQMTDREDQQMR